MKKKDIEAELPQVNRVLVNHIAGMFQPFIQLMGLLTRRAFLEEELRKVTPRPQAPPTAESPEAKIEMKLEESGEPIQEKSN